MPKNRTSRHQRKEPKRTKGSANNGSKNFKSKTNSHSSRNVPTPEHGIRNCYSSMGVCNYYTNYGNSYRNPHELKIHQSLNKMLKDVNSNEICINFSRILDLCCGSGEMTLYFTNYCNKHKLICNSIDGIDPYTYDAYEKRTLKICQKYTFKDIANGMISNDEENESLTSTKIGIENENDTKDENESKCQSKLVVKEIEKEKEKENKKRYSLIVCSYALHLCKESLLPSVCYCLSMVGDNLMIITPHKRPQISPQWGWKLIYENVCDKVRLRLYQSLV